MKTWMLLTLFFSHFAFANEYENYLKTIDLDKLSPEQKKEVLNSVNKNVSKTELKKSRDQYQEKIVQTFKSSVKDKGKLKTILDKISKSIFNFSKTNKSLFKQKTAKVTSGATAIPKTPKEPSVAINENNLTSNNIFVIHSEIYRLIQEGIK